MKKSKKTTLIIAFCLIFAGIAIIAGVLITSNFDFGRIDGSVYITNDYDFDKEVKNIHINCDTAGINILSSDDNSCRLSCYEDEKLPHTVKLEDGTLSVNKAQKHWYDYIKLFSFRTPKITLYLPDETYNSIIVNTDTGHISTDGISAAKTELQTSTGHITITNTEYTDSIDAEASTGKITIQNTSCGSLNAEASTGRITLENVKAMDIYTEADTGDITFTNTTAEGNISAETSTGDIIFEASDGYNIFAHTSTGHIKGTILSVKTFNATSDTGKVSVPHTQGFGMFEASASTGDINISYTTE